MVINYSFILMKVIHWSHHIHVRKAGNEAKFWLEPVSLARNDGFNAKELKELLIYISTQKEVIQGYWYDYFG